MIVRCRLCWVLLLAACSPNDPSKPRVVDTAWSVDDPEAGSCAAIYDGPDARILPPDRTFAACDSASPIWYEDVAVAWGFTPPTIEGNDHSKGGTVAVHDFNNDGWLDIMFGYNNADLMYFVGSADGFRMQRIEGAGGDGQLTLFDMDADGDMDIASAGSPLMILRNNDGDFDRHFFSTDDVAGTIGFSPADFDGDGHLDLYVTTAGGQGPDPSARADRYLFGDGSGRFERSTLPVPDAGGVGFDSVSIDLDADGDTDVYTVNDFGHDFGGNVLWENQDGSLASRKDDCACDLAISGMGVDAADIDGDALPELLIASTGSNHLLKQTGDGVYVDIAEATGADPLRGIPTMAWGQIFFDYNDDGLLDILVAEGDLWTSATSPELRKSYDAPLHLLVNEGTRAEPHFVDRATEVGLDQLGSWRAIVPADFNADGIPDLVITDVDGPPKLFLARGCSGNGAFELDLPPQSRVEACIDGERHVRWATTEYGWGAGGPSTVRFGTGGAPAPERVVVVLPPGAAL